MGTPFGRIRCASGPPYSQELAKEAVHSVKLSCPNGTSLRCQTRGNLGESGPQRWRVVMCPEASCWLVCAQGAGAPEKDAGFPKLRLHDLRHQFASLLVNHGRTLYEVKEILGHSSQSVTERYAHLSKDTLRDSANSAAELRASAGRGRRPEPHERRYCVLPLARRAGGAAGECRQAEEVKREIKVSHDVGAVAQAGFGIPFLAPRI